jgi:hypothetical protein
VVRLRLVNKINHSSTEKHLSQNDKLFSKNSLNSHDNNLYVCPLGQLMKVKSPHILLLKCLLLIGMLNLHLAVSQEPYAIQLNRSSGLPSVSVYQCYQDKDGFIWIASDVGITRYDGFHFQTYKSDEQTAFSGSCIREDEFGRIWYQNFDGYNYFVDKSTRSLKALDQNNSSGFLQYGFTENHFFHISSKGIETYDLKSLKKTKTIKLSVNDPQYTAFDSIFFYFLEDNNIYRVDSNLKLSKAKSPFNNKNSKQIYCLNGDTLVLTQKYNNQNLLFFYSTDLKLLSSIEIPNIQLIHTVNFIDNLIWISTPSGVYVYSKSGVLQNHYFKNLSVSGVIKDRQNNYWFTTTNQGIFIVPNLKNKFLFERDKLPNRIAKIDNQNYLISTKKGELFLVNKDFQIIRTIVNAPEKGEIYFLNYNPKDRIISYTANGFYQLDENYNLILRSPSAVKDIKKIDEKYWAYASSNNSGLFTNTYSKNNSSVWDQVESKQTFENFFDFYINNRARSVAYDSVNKRIFFATNIGLFTVNQNKKGEILNNGNTFYASKLHFFGSHLYALSTKGMLYRIDKEGKFELLNTKFNIDEYDIKFCSLNGEDLIFASSSYIHQLNLKSKKHFIYNLNISSYDINDILVDGDDLYLLINEGIIKTTRRSGISSVIKPVFKINGIVTKDTTLNANEKIEFAYPNDEITVKYAILDFGNTIPLDLKYRINGGVWQMTSQNSRELNFPSLKPGTYTIEFELGEEILTEKVNFTVLGPWWRSWWFIVFVIVLVLGIVSIIYWARVKSLSRRNKLLEENVKLEQNLRKSVLTAVKSQMNPHFFYNALNTIQAFIYTNDKENAGKYLLKFSQLTRQVLEMSEKDYVNLEEEIQTIHLYLELEKARFDEDFEYHIDDSSISSKESLKVPPMLIQPYIENAIKHGLLHKTGQKILSILFEEVEGYLNVTIEDNGIGRKRSSELNQKRNAEHKSFAGEANNRRLEVLNYGRTQKLVLIFIDKHDEFGKPTGTKVVLRIPL